MQWPPKNSETRDLYDQTDSMECSVEGLWWQALAGRSTWLHGPLLSLVFVLGYSLFFSPCKAQQSPGSRSVQSPQMVCNISYGAGTVPALSTHWLWQGTDINKTQISMSQAGLLWGEGRIIHTLWKVEGWGAIFTSVSTTKTVNKLLISVTCDKRVRK